MTYGRQQRVNEEINWVTDEDGNVLGTMSPDGRTLMPLVSGAGKSTVEQWSTRPGVGASPGSSSIATAQTWQVVVGTRLKYYAFRVRYLNPSLAAYTVSKTVAKSSDTWNSSKTPTGAAAVLNVLWGGSASTTAAAGTGVDIGVSPWSDWCQGTPVDRVDVPGAPWLTHIRTYFDGTAAYVYAGSANDANYPGNTAAGLARSYGQQGGDATTFADTAVSYANGNALLMEVEFLSLGATVRGVGLGDSQTASSSCSDGGNIRYHLADRVAAAANAAPNKRSGVTYTGLSHGWGSQTYTQIIGRLSAVLATEKVDVLYLPAGSVNSLLSTQADFDVNMSLFLRAVQQCKDANVKIVVWSIPTRNSATLAQDTLRRSYNTAVAAYCAVAGIPFADVAAVIGDGVSPEKIKATYDVGDGLHWNAAGVDAAAAAIAAATLAAGI